MGIACIIHVPYRLLTGNESLDILLRTAISLELLLYSEYEKHHYTAYQIKENLDHHKNLTFSFVFQTKLQSYGQKH